MKIAMIGVGAVGASAAYALMISGLAAEIVLIDVNEAKAEDYRKATHTVFHDAARPSGIGVGLWAGKRE